MSSLDTTGGAAQATRKVSPLLAIGIFVIPFIFAWFTLRRGYSVTARIAAFAWMVLSFVLIGGFGGDGAPGSSGSTSQRGGDELSFAQVMTDAIAAPQMGALSDKVARDAVDQYQISRSGGDKIQICVQAGLVAAAYLQAKNQLKYVEWKEKERADCAAAGLPKD